MARKSDKRSYYERHPEYRKLVALVNRAEDISLEGCTRDVTEANVHICKHGVNKMAFQTTTLARQEPDAYELGSLIGSVRLVIR